MKAKIIKTGEVVEVYQTVAGWASENMNKIRVFEESELDFDYCEWEIFRREAAKDVLSGLASWNTDHYVSDDVKLAINYADELIKQLKEEKK